MDGITLSAHGWGAFYLLGLLFTSWIYCIVFLVKFVIWIFRGAKVVDPLGE